MPDLWFNVIVALLVFATFSFISNFLIKINAKSSAITNMQIFATFLSIASFFFPVLCGILSLGVAGYYLTRYPRRY